MYLNRSFNNTSATNINQTFRLSVRQNALLPFLPAVLLAALLATLLFLSGCDGNLEYSGDKLNGLPHGSGTWNHPNCISYNGEWQADAYHNLDKLSIPDNFYYEGAWLEGKKKAAAPNSSPMAAVIWASSKTVVCKATV